MILESVYKEIAAHLATVLENPGYPMQAIQFIDLFNNQLNKEDVPFDSPAILVQFGPIQWESLPKGVQKGVATLRFHVVQEIYEDSYQGNDEQDNALNVLRYVDVVHQALSGLAGSKFTELTRVSTEPDEDHDNLIIYVMDYGTIITDDSAITSRALVPVIPVLGIVKGVERPARPTSPYSAD
jgi:hypothetical protein